MSRVFFLEEWATTLQVGMLIALQVTATALLWFLNPISQLETDTFALYLSVDLVAFALLSYQYRSRREGVRANVSWLSIGYLLLVVLLTSNLIIAG